MADKDEVDWTAVAARAQAYQALHLADLGERPILERAGFLMTLGLSRSEAAGLLGSTDESLRVQMSRAKKKAAAQAVKSTGDADA